jgi:cytochrome bd-type quinol oxidase subunit 2
MLQTIKNTIALLALVLAVPVLSGLAVPSVSAATDIQGSLCQGAELSATGSPANCATTTGGSGEKVNSLISDVINIFSLIVGVVSVIMIIIGGFQYITSSGDSNKVGTAKNTILYAIIGLVIVALAQFIVRFVLSRVTD